MYCTYEEEDRLFAFVVLEFAFVVVETSGLSVILLSVSACTSSGRSGRKGGVVKVFSSSSKAAYTFQLNQWFGKNSNTISPKLIYLSVQEIRINNP